MNEKANSVLAGLMAIGYGARGAVYLLIGIIAIYAALIGGDAEGSSGAFATLENQPFGRWLLGLIGIGILAYVAWRFVDAVFDLEDEGDDASGWMARAGQAMSGATHAALAFSALTIAFTGGGGNDGGTQAMTAQVMAQPFGRFLVGAVALTTISVGIYLFYKAATASYKKKIRRTATTERLAPLVRFGLAAHGFVLLIIGGLLGYAAVQTDASNAAGLGEALNILANQAYGQILLTLAGIGMIGFAAYCFVRSVWGISPKLSQGDIPTLG